MITNKIKNMKLSREIKTGILLLLITFVITNSFAQGPYPKTGPQSTCLNSIEPYQVNFNSGSTYQWSIAPVTAGTITQGATPNSISVNWSVAGVATLQLTETISSTGCSNTVSIQVTVNVLPAPPTASDQSICSDGTTTQTITASATGGTITWYNSPTSGSVVTTPTQVGPGTSIYYAESSNGTCSSATRTKVTLTINPKPATSPISHN